MKRRRRKHTGYHSASKHKVLFRVLFVIACTFILTALSILLGSHLKKMADSVQTRDESEGDALSSTDTQAQTEDLFSDGILSTSDASSLTVCATDISLIDENAETIASKLGSLSEIYNAVSVRVTLDDRLVYVSPALLEYARINPDAVTPGISSENQTAQNSENNNDAINPYENLKTVISVAHDKNFRTSARYTTRSVVLEDSAEAISNIEIDKVVIGELSELGYDEIIIEGLISDDTELTIDSTKKIVSYLAMVRTVSKGADIGITLPASVYLDTPTASSIMSLSMYTDFLAISISADADTQDKIYEEIHEEYYPLKGNFSVYNIRAIINEESSDASSAAYSALYSLSVKNIQFSVYDENPDYTPPGGNTDTGGAETGGVNGNAKTKDKYTETESSSALITEPSPGT